MDLSFVAAVSLASTSPIAIAADTPVALPELSVTSDELAEGGTLSREPQADDQETAVDPERVESSAPKTGNQIIVTGDLPPPPGDPLVKLNETTFAVTQSVDRAVVQPVAEVYEEKLPKPVRRGLRNFFRNLLEPVNFLNYMLQLKPGKAAETLGRFTINSTVGVAGLIDVAKKKPFNLPYRRNGLANTLGYYGVGPGPFLMVPLVGATTLRDLLGGLIDQSVVPLAVGAPFDTPYYAVPAYTVNSLEFRIEFDEKLTQINDSVEPYTAMREVYLCQREADIAALKNRPPPRDCSVDALMADPVQPVAAPALIEPIEQLENEPEQAPQQEASSETLVDVPVSEPVYAPAPIGLHHPSLTLENGCALLEQGVDTLYVISC